jgi:hypothetical protein
MTAPPRPGRIRDSVRSVTERIEEVLLAAERVAAEIQADAEAQAATYLSEARSEAEEYSRRRREAADAAAGERRATLDALAADLCARRSSLRERAAELEREIERVLAVIGQLADAAEDEAPRAAQGDRTKPPLAVAYPGSGDAHERRGPEAATEEALLRATQLAVAGSRRADIEAALRAEFGLDDPAGVVDEILGDAAAGTG